MPPDRRTIGPDHRTGSFGDRLQLYTSPARIVPLCPRASFRMCPGTKNAARAFSYTGAVLVPAAFGAVQDRIKGRYSFDWGEDDYVVIDETQAVDETQIGRIYKERVSAGVKWLWFLQVVRAPPPNQGIADTLDEAKAALTRRYEEVRRGK